jgi:hypothetical protein
MFCSLLFWVLALASASAAQRVLMAHNPAIVISSGVISSSAVAEYARAIRRDVTDRGPGRRRRLALNGPLRM